jgi:hypothetical protein
MDKFLLLSSKSLTCFLFLAMLCASTLIVVTGIIGIFAVQRKDRSLLACHTLLLWPCLALLASVAYLSYRDTTWDMKTILGMKWRYDLTPEEQFQLQETVSMVYRSNA